MPVARVPALRFSDLLLDLQQHSQLLPQRLDFAVRALLHSLLHSVQQSHRLPDLRFQPEPLQGPFRGPVHPLHAIRMRFLLLADSVRFLRLHWQLLPQCCQFPMQPVFPPQLSPMQFTDYLSDLRPGSQLFPQRFKSALLNLHYSKLSRLQQPHNLPRLRCRQQLLRQSEFRPVPERFACLRRQHFHFAGTM